MARIVNDLEIDVRHGHFWGMDEWVENGRPVSTDHPLSFAKADLDLCFNRIRTDLRMPDEHIHFPIDIESYAASYDQVRCVLMQGGQGEVKHWAFNDPPKREGAYADEPPPAEEYRKLGTAGHRLAPDDSYPKRPHVGRRVRAAGADGGGDGRPGGDLEIRVRVDLASWPSRQSVRHPANGADDLSKRIVDTAVPMSLLADHPNVRFQYYRGGIGSVEAEMH